MKITSIDIFDFAKCLNYEDCAPICIRINTDSGICGFGEVGLAYGNAHNAGIGMVKDFGQLIIGMDPLNSEAIREKLFRTTFWGMGGGIVINAGMSAIDIALWDIKGKYYKARSTSCWAARPMRSCGPTPARSSSTGIWRTGTWSRRSSTPRRPRRPWPRATRR